MEIVVNGDPRDVPAGTTVAELIAILELSGKRLATEINLELVPRSSYEQHLLVAGDKIEIVHAIGGG